MGTERIIRTSVRPKQEEWSFHILTLGGEYFVVCGVGLTRLIHLSKQLEQMKG